MCVHLSLLLFFFFADFYKLSFSCAQLKYRLNVRRMKLCSVFEVLHLIAFLWRYNHSFRWTTATIMHYKKSIQEVNSKQKAIHMVNKSSSFQFQVIKRLNAPHSWIIRWRIRCKYFMAPIHEKLLASLYFYPVYVGSWTLFVSLNFFFPQGWNERLPHDSVLIFRPRARLCVRPRACFFSSFFGWTFTRKCNRCMQITFRDLLRCTCKRVPN